MGWFFGCGPGRGGGPGPLGPWGRGGGGVRWWRRRGVPDILFQILIICKMLLTFVVLLTSDVVVVLTAVCSFITYYLLRSEGISSHPR